MDKFKAAGAIAEVQNAAELRQTLEALLQDTERARELGAKALAVVEQYQGVTEKSAELICRKLKAVTSIGTAEEAVVS